MRGRARRARDVDALGLATREILHLRPGDLGGARALEDIHRLLALCLRDGDRPTPAQVRDDHLERRRREVAVEALSLRHVTDPAPRLARRLVLDDDRARVRLDEAEDHLEERRLARAVRPAETQELADRHEERDVLEHLARPVAHADVGHLEHARSILGRQRPVVNAAVLAARLGERRGRRMLAHCRYLASASVSKRRSFSYESVCGVPPTGSSVPSGMFAASAMVLAGRASSCGSL